MCPSATPHLPYLSTCPAHHSGLKGGCGPPFLSSFPPCGQLFYQVPSALRRCASHSGSLPTIPMVSLLPGPASPHCWPASMDSPPALCHMPLLKSQQGIFIALRTNPKGLGMALWGLRAGGYLRPLHTPPPAHPALVTWPHQPVAAPVQFSSPRQLRAPPPFIQWLPMDTSSGSPPGPPHHVCTEAQSFSTPRTISSPSFSSLYLPAPDISTPLLTDLLSVSSTGT